MIVQVALKEGGKRLTYKTDKPVVVGDRVLVPAGEWNPAKIVPVLEIGSDYTGYLRTAEKVD